MNYPTKSYLEDLEFFDSLPIELRRSYFPVEEIGGSEVSINEIILKPEVDLDKATMLELIPYIVKELRHSMAGKHGAAKITAKLANYTSGVTAAASWISSAHLFKPDFFKGVVKIESKGKDTWKGVVINTSDPDLIPYFSNVVIDVQELMSSCRNTINRSEFNFSAWGGCLTFTSKNKNDDSVD